MNHRPRARRRPERFAHPPVVLCNHGVRRVQNVLRGAVVLLQTDDRCIRVRLVERQDVLNRRAAEAVDALVVVADHHQIPPSLGKHPRQLKLRNVRVLILVHADVAETLLVVLQNLGMPTEQEHRLHDDIVEIQRVGFAQDLLIGGIDPRDLPHAEIRARLGFEVLGGQEAILRAADRVCNRLDRQELFVDSAPFERLGVCLFAVIGVINGKSRVIARRFGVAAQDAHADRVERSRHDLGAPCGVVGEHGVNAAFDLLCRLIGKGNRQNGIGWAGIFGKRVEHRAQLLLCAGFRRLREVVDLLVGQPVGDGIREIRVPVADDKRDAADEHGGLSAPRARKDKQGVIDGIDRFPLAVVEVVVNRVKQGAFGGKIAFGKRHSVLRSFLAAR